MRPAQSVVICEGIDDRAFLAGWLRHLGCAKPTTVTIGDREIVLDPWREEVSRGQFGFTTPSGLFVRVVPAHGVAKRTALARRFLRERDIGKQLDQLVLVTDSDRPAPTVVPPNVGAYLELAREFDPDAGVVDGAIVMIGGTRLQAIVWQTPDPPIPGVPDQQSLERLVCAALAEAYADRAAAVEQWLSDQRVGGNPEHKAHAWSYMAGWAAGAGCQDFYTKVWDDVAIATALQSRLTAINAWSIAQSLIT